MNIFFEIISVTGFAIEAAGVLVIVAGTIQATISVLTQRSKGKSEDPYREYRREIGRAMMLGLEFLVAGDIIRTVIVEHSMVDIASLGLLVLIRTVLVFTIHLEVEGRWPWQPAPVHGEPGSDDGV